MLVLGVLLIKYKKFSDAKNILTDSCLAGSYLAKNLVGDIHTRTYDFISAIRSYQKSLDQQPNEGAYLGLSNAYMKTGKPELALESMKHCVSISPSSINLCKLANLHRNQKEYIEAISCYQRSKEIKDNFEASMGIALSFYMLNNFKKCITELENSLHFNETKATWELLGFASLKEKKYLKCVDYFKKSLGYKYESCWRSHYGISIAYSQLGMHTQSLRELTRSQLAGMPSNNHKGIDSLQSVDPQNFMLLKALNQSARDMQSGSNTLSSSYKNLVEILAIIIKTNRINPLVFRSLVSWSFSPGPRQKN